MTPALVKWETAVSTAQAISVEFTQHLPLVTVVVTDLTSSNKKKTIEFVWQDVLATEVSRTYFQRTARLQHMQIKGPTLEVKESRWAESFEDSESLELVYGQLRHFVIVGINSTIEILSPQLPSIRE